MNDVWEREGKKNPRMRDLFWSVPRAITDGKLSSTLLPSTYLLPRMPNILEVESNSKTLHNSLFEDCQLFLINCNKFCESVVISVANRVRLT